MAYQPGINPNLPQYNGGVVPVTAEPLTDWEEQGLSGLANANHGGLLVASRDQGMRFAANPSQEAGRYIDPNATQAYNNMGGAIQQGTQGFTLGNAANFLNPWQQQVTDATLQGISEDEARRSASLTAGQGQRGARSFGDSSGAIQMSELARNMDALRARTRADLNSQGFNNAVTNYGNERSRDLQGAGLYGQQGAGYQSNMNSGVGNALSSIGGLAELGNNYYDQGSRAAQDKVNAGGYVRNFNQGIANQIGGEISGVTGMDKARLSDLAQMLGVFSDSPQQSTQEPNWANKIGGGLVSLGGIQFPADTSAASPQAVAAQNAGGYQIPMSYLRGY